MGKGVTVAKLVEDLNLLKQKGFLRLPGGKAAYKRKIREQLNLIEHARKLERHEKGIEREMSYEHGGEVSYYRPNRTLAEKVFPNGDREEYDESGNLTHRFDAEENELKIEKPKTEKTTRAKIEPKITEEAKKAETLVMLEELIEKIEARLDGIDRELEEIPDKE